MVFLKALVIFCSFKEIWKVPCLISWINNCRCQRNTHEVDNFLKCNVTVRNNLLTWSYKFLYCIKYSASVISFQKKDKWSTLCYVASQMQMRLHNQNGQPTLALSPKCKIIKHLMVKRYFTSPIWIVFAINNILSRPTDQ